MKPRFLFPNYCRTIGWIIAVPALIAGIWGLFNEFKFDFLFVELPFHYLLDDGFLQLTKEPSRLELGDEVVSIALIVGLGLVAFSKCKLEDEFVSQIRLESLQWAIYVHFGFVLLATIFVYGIYFFNVMIVNMFTPLLIFVGRFQYLVYIHNHSK